MRLSDDWQGADFIAQHKDGAFLKVQLKGRLSFFTKYSDKNLYICCPFRDAWLLYPHDELMKKVLEVTTIGETASWAKGGYSMKSVPKKLLSLVEPYMLAAVSTQPPKDAR